MGIIIAGMQWPSPVFIHILGARVISDHTLVLLLNVYLHLLFLLATCRIRQRLFFLLCFAPAQTMYFHPRRWIVRAQEISVQFSSYLLTHYPAVGWDSGFKAS